MAKGLNGRLERNKTENEPLEMKITTLINKGFLRGTLVEETRLLI